MKKNLLLGFMCVVSLFFTTACGGNESNVNNGVDEGNKENNSVADSSVTPAADYTELEIFGAKVKFKLADPTYLWNCEDSFGAGEVDTVFIPSKNGVEVENYYDAEHISGVTFQTSDDSVDSATSLKNSFKKSTGIDLTVEDIKHDIYTRHLKGENSEVYFESYAFKYDGNYEGEELGDIYYSIRLWMYKDDYTKEEINKVIAEYHTMIDTLEFVK